MKDRAEIIKNYIEGYNRFNVEQMIADLDDNLIFENISNGKITDSLEGKVAFSEQAEEAKSFFSDREQTITSMDHFENYSEVNIDYEATLAIEFSEELKIGDKIRMKGYSIFEFSAENKITVIKDFS